MGFLPMLGAFGISSALATATAPLQNWAAQELNKLFPVVKPTPSELVLQRYKGDITEQQFFELMATHGLDQENSTNIYQGSRTILDTTGTIILFRRQELDKDAKKNEEIFYEIMQNNGANKETADQMLESTMEFENTQEVFTWLIREVLDDKKRKELRLDEEFPAESLNFAKRLGIPEYRMRNNWASHWRLAEPQQLAESLHRYHPKDKEFWEKEVKELGLDGKEVATDMDDMLTLLKVADVAPSYRQRIAANSYRNLGLIETRWMIRFRFAELKEATYFYKRSGLPEVIARRVAQVVFVVQSITDWKDGIRLGALTWENVLQELSEWEIDQERLLAVVQRKVAPEMIEGVKDVRDFTLSMTRNFFLDDQITEDKALELLEDINYGDFQRKLIMDKWNIEKQSRQDGATKKAKQISKTDIKQRFVKGLISETVARVELKEARYSDKDIPKLIELWQVIKESKAA